MILPINRAYSASCIFCGEAVIFRGRGGEYVKLKDGKRIIAIRRFHRSCYLENARKSKAQRKEG